jgi:hypothetical protein
VAATTASVSPALDPDRAPAPAPAQRWLFGPAPDLLLGCGLLYILLFGAFAVSGEWFARAMPAWLAPLLILLASVPHYGATLLRVYEQRGDRRRYTIFAVWISLALLTWFVLGQHDARVGSLMLTVYLTWSPWHYTGQNYGLAVLFLRRRGISLEPVERRWLQTSFVLSYALTFAVIHESGDWALSRQLALEGPRVHFIPLQLPAAGALLPVLALAYLAVLGRTVVGLRRRRPFRELAPALLLVATQALWFSLPYVARHWSLFTGVPPLDRSLQVQFLLWIAVGHSVQYLWVTAYFARASPHWPGLAPYLGKAFAAGALIWTLPVIVFAPALLGAVTYDAGLALLVASAVNLHHFVLDGAIWKLRSGPIARVLVRSESAEQEGDGSRQSPWPRRATWATAIGCAAVALLVFGGQDLVAPRAIAAGHHALAAGTLDGLAWVGRDSAALRLRLGRAYAMERELDAALPQLERSLALVPSGDAHGQIATVYAMQGRFDLAAPHCERLLDAMPDRPVALRLAGLVFQRTGQPERGRELLARAETLETLEARVEAATSGTAPGPKKPVVY